MDQQILNKLVKETHQDPEVIKYAIKNMWLNVRYYITHPEESKQKILLTNLLQFEIVPRRINSYLRVKGHLLSDEKKLYFSNILKQLKK